LTPFTKSPVALTVIGEPGRAALIQLINLYRSMLSPPVAALIDISTTSSTWNSVSRWMSDSIAGNTAITRTTVSTTDSLGRSVSQRYQAFGYSPTFSNNIAELIFKDEDCLDYVFKAWASNAAMNAVLTSSYYKYIGLGISSLSDASKASWGWVADFSPTMS
jgi:hypothetical protein